METMMSNIVKETDPSSIQFRTAPPMDGNHNDPPLIQFGPGKQIFVLGVQIFEVEDHPEGDFVTKTLDVEKLTEALSVFLNHIRKDMLSYGIENSSVPEIVAYLMEHGKYNGVLDSNAE